MTLGKAFIVLFYKIRNKNNVSQIVMKINENGTSVFVGRYFISIFKSLEAGKKVIFL